METKYHILAINPGSTTTKIALYENSNLIYKETIEHSNQELAQFKTIAEQFLYRKEAVMNALLFKNKYDINILSAVVGRGGMLPPVKSGAYRINEAMVDRLTNRPISEHASNLGALIAFEIAEPLGIPAYIYDPVAVDEMENVARVTGLPEILRVSTSHALNARAMAMKVAKKMNCQYADLNLIVAHLGGGISLSVHHNGKMVDIISDDEGPFSPERAGRIPARLMTKLCFTCKYEQDEILKKLRGKGGLVAHLGTNSALEVENRVKKGDEKAALIYSAMAYQVAKGIGELATVVHGSVDRIILTGGLAQSSMLTESIKERVRFIAPVEIMPGENELESLAYGTLRVLEGTEEAQEYYEERTAFSF